jgi:dTDP-4-dehydrorhamnose 3,5-epimerase
MQIFHTEIQDVKIIQPQIFGDHRGFFMETFRDDLFRQTIADTVFVQENHSMSGQGVLRGLHYQIHQPQGKLVRIIRGTVFDVAVDIREKSKDFGRWVGVTLSAENKKMLWVPPGFAHGFYVLSKQAELVYKCTDYYAPAHERAILWNDPDIGIDWPLLDENQPLLSSKDAAGERFGKAEVFK